MEKRQFEGFYQDFFDRIYKFVFYRVGGNRELARDLTQDIFLKAFEAFERFDPKQGQVAWIYTIARNHVINSYAKQHSGVTLDDVEGSLAASHDPHETYLFRQEEEGLYQALAKLPPDDARLVKMKYLEGWSFDELAEIFEKTPPTLRVQASRILKKMQSFLHKPTL